jgi:hypothetical protein
VKIQETESFGPGHLIPDCIRLGVCTKEICQAWTGRQPNDADVQDSFDLAVAELKLRLPLPPALASFVSTCVCARSLAVADLQVVAQIEAAHRLVLPGLVEQQACSVATPNLGIDLGEWNAADGGPSSQDSSMSPDFYSCAALLFREMLKLVGEQGGLKSW